MFDLLNGWPDEDGNESVDKSRNHKGPEFIAELLERQKFTPDFKNFRMREDNLVFVYDEFKKQGLWNNYLADSKFLGEGRTAHNGYQMKMTVGSVPWPVVMIHNPVNPGMIRGEVYAVLPETIQKLDKLNRNGEVFERRERTIMLLDQEYPSKKGVRHPTQKCWMYIGIPEFWRSKGLNMASAIVPQNSNNKRYYEYAVQTNRVLWARGGRSPWAGQQNDEDYMRRYGGYGEYMM